MLKGIVKSIQHINTKNNTRICLIVCDVVFVSTRVGTYFMVSLFSPVTVVSLVGTCFFRKTGQNSLFRKQCDAFLWRSVMFCFYFVSFFFSSFMSFMGF